MKRHLSLLLVILVLLANFSTAVASTLDLSPIEAKSSLYTIDLSSDKDAAFIETTLTAMERSFTHKYDSSKLYSTTKFDVLVVNYQTPSNYPIFRLWVSYCADDAFQNIEKATFAMGNKQYTFSDISDPDWLVYDAESGYTEDVLIRFNEDNLSFLMALEEMTTGKGTIEELNQSDLRLILHGNEDIEITLGSGFLLDFIAIKNAWLTLNGKEYLDKVTGSDMSVTTAY